MAELELELELELERGQEVEVLSVPAAFEGKVEHCPVAHGTSGMRRSWGGWGCCSVDIPIQQVVVVVVASVQAHGWFDIEGKLWTWTSYQRSYSERMSILPTVYGSAINYA